MTDWWDRTMKKKCVFCKRKKKVESEHFGQWLCAHCGRYNDKYIKLSESQVKQALKEMRRDRL